MERIFHPHPFDNPSTGLEQGRAGSNLPTSALSKEKGLSGRVRAALYERALAGSTLLVAVSGGPDSLALLHALYGLRDEFGLNLRGAHLNHELRGTDSDADAEFAARVFRQLGIPFTAGSADVAAYRSRHKLSLEDAARRVRYAFLAGAAERHDADAVTLGHTADDQAETVLMHIIRGSGLNGLRGMSAVDTRAIDGKPITLFRPLLGARRSETQAYCRAFGLEPRVDASNSSTEFLRNRIRLELLPLLERMNPSVRDALLRLSANAVEDNDYIGAQADEVRSEAVQVSDGGVVRLDTVALGRQHAAIQSRVLRRVVEEAGGEVTRRHILDMLGLIGGAPGKNLHLSGGLTFVTGYGAAYIGSAGAVEEVLAPLPVICGEFPVTVPGEMRVGGWRIKASVIDGIDGRSFLPDRPRPNPPLEGERISITEMLDMGCVGDALRVRRRLPGDRFQPLGMEQPKSLREFMIDARIPRRWRDGLPLVVSERGIVCVPGWRVAHWARVTEATKNVLRLEVTLDR